MTRVRYRVCLKLHPDLQVLDNSPFSVLHFNVRSLTNKLDDLQQYLGELVHKFSVIGISETWLNIDNESQIQLPGYSFVNNN